MTIFKAIYPPQKLEQYSLFPELSEKNKNVLGVTPIQPTYVNPAQVVSIGMRGTVPALYLTDGRCIETQFPTTEHLEYYMATENNRPNYRSTQLEFFQVTEIVPAEFELGDLDADSSVDLFDNSLGGDCQSPGTYFEYTPTGPIYAGPNTLPVLEIEETTWGGVLDLSSYTDKA
tara:strand:+ start:4693 stop:5214 length:522 start_codon:yes stop_codon:yes gene_type:complete